MGPHNISATPLNTDTMWHGHMCQVSEHSHWLICMYLVHMHSASFPYVGQKFATLTRHWKVSSHCWVHQGIVQWITEIGSWAHRWNIGKVACHQDSSCNVNIGKIMLSGKKNAAWNTRNQTNIETLHQQFCLMNIRKTHDVFHEQLWFFMVDIIEWVHNNYGSMNMMYILHMA